MSSLFSLTVSFGLFNHLFVYSSINHPFLGMFVLFLPFFCSVLLFIYKEKLKVNVG